METRRRISDLALAEVISQIVRLTSGPSFAQGLNPAQWAALRYLGGSPPGLRTVAAFSRYHGTSKGTASQTIAALTRKGLLSREVDEGDRRFVRFHPTAEAEALMCHDPIGLVADAVSCLSEDEHRRLAQLMEKVMRAALARRGPPRDEEALTKEREEAEEMA